MSVVRLPGRRRRDQSGDDGSVLLLVLVMMLIGTFVVVPVMTYSITVFRAQNIQGDKARAVELARGGTWVALANEGPLYDDCGVSSIASSLSGVSTTCTVLESTTLRQPEEVPFSVATIQADVGDGTRAEVPAELQVGLLPEQVYVNPNGVDVDPDGWDDWLATPDWSAQSTKDKVWVPQLPTQATSSGGTRDTTMVAGAQDPLYASCRVFFPGTFTSPITIAEPTYFTSGVYYFTEPITVNRGADVVVGNGAAGGCTTDFEAIAGATVVPDPLNMSGLGGTFVLGGNARIIFDDTVGAGDIRFAMNQRYVSDDEASVSASSSVSIVSVNGTHEPLITGEVLGSDLSIPGVLAVPASTVDDPTDDPDDPTDDPTAITKNYTPSIHTPKQLPPDPPTNVTFEGWQYGGNTSDYYDDRGHMVVSWDAPADNGLPVSGYVATASPSGRTCSPAPSPDSNGDGVPDYPLQLTCTIDGIIDAVSGTAFIDHTVTVVATNAAGDSDPSDPSPGSRVDLYGSFPSSQVPVLDVPDAPTNVTLGGSYSDGLMVRWDAPADDGGTPISSYTVTATPFALPLPALPPVGTTVTCTSWWDETGCLLPITNPLDIGPYAIEVVATNFIGDSAPAIYDDPIDIPLIEPDPHTFTLGASAAPVRALQTESFPIPDPILDFTMASAATVRVDVAGYVSVPQGHVRFDAVVPANKHVALQGGLVAAQIRMDAAPDSMNVVFDNPIAQKRIRLRSTGSVGGYSATSDAVVRVNRSGSIAINSWFVQ
jgi:hypothetical protein